jgi:hypothetical protein
MILSACAAEEDPEETLVLEIKQLLVEFSCRLKDRRNKPFDKDSDISPTPEYPDLELELPEFEAQIAPRREQLVTLISLAF